MVPGSPSRPSENREAPKTQPTDRQLEGLRIDATAEALRKQIERKDFEGALTTVKNLLQGPRPKESVTSLFDKLKNSVTKADAEKLAELCAQREETSPAVKQLLGNLTSLSQEVGGSVPEQIGTLTRRIVVFGNTLADRLKPTAEQVAGQLGFTGVAEGAIQFLKDFIFSRIADVLEKTAMSFKNIPKANSIFETAFQLRRLSMPEKTDEDKILKKKYSDACVAWLKSTKTTPPPTPDSVSAQIAQAQNKPAETKPAEAVAEKVEGSKAVELVDGKKVTFTNVNRETKVEVGGLTRKVKIAGESVPEAAVIKPAGVEKGIVEFRMPNKNVKVDLIALHQAVKEDKKQLDAVDGTTKINLEPV